MSIMLSLAGISAGRALPPPLPPVPVEPAVPPPVATLVVLAAPPAPPLPADVLVVAVGELVVVVGLAGASSELQPTRRRNAAAKGASIFMFRYLSQ
jgi:hypothetical protein